MSSHRRRLTSGQMSSSWFSLLLVLLFSPLNTSAANLVSLNLTPPNPTLNINETLQLISAANHDTCALFANGTVKCWGSNYYGQLGNGTSTDSSIPVPVSGISDAVAVSGGAGAVIITASLETLRVMQALRLPKH